MNIAYKKRFLFGPKAGCPWADKMVLNPAMVQDPDDADTLHILFRATGPWPQARMEGRPMPYPIFLGYGVSHDRGATWNCDFSRPAKPMPFKFNPDTPPLIHDAFGREVFDYTNGHVEDPRLFYFAGPLYCTLAGRPFPPGPYWEHDDPKQCVPPGFEAFGESVTENYTVTQLYKVNLNALKSGDYDHAFTFVVQLHDPEISDDRDVVLFPHRLMMGDRPRIVCIHRPKWPWRYDIGKDVPAPSIFMAAADSLADFSNGKAERIVFAQRKFKWEENRVGASWAPMEIEPGLWLLPYHGKQDDTVGYTQSFMLLRENGKTFPDIVARPSERLFFAQEPWELEGDFTIPCLFTCSGVLMDDGILRMGYGAADARVGLLEVDFNELVEYLKKNMQG